MTSNSEDRHEASMIRAVEAQGDARMAVENVDDATQSVREFLSFVSSNCRDVKNVETAKLACEKSRTAWLALFPYRSIFSSKYRALLGDFAQTLDDATTQVARFIYRNEVSLSTTDSDDLHHYLENMNARLKLLTSLLVSEEQVEAVLQQSTSSLAVEK